MTRQIDDGDRMLDRVLDEIRRDTPDEPTELSITRRVWERVGAELAGIERGDIANRKIRSCADFQGLLPAYADGALTGPRRLLLEDHLGECVPCRRAWNERRRPRRLLASEGAERSGWASRLGWRTAVAAIIALAVIGLSVQTDVFSFTTGGFVRVKEIEGELFRVGANGSVPLAVGDEFVLDDGDEILTAKGSRAVLELRDETRLEMNQRSQLSLGERRHLLPWRETDGIVGLDRGNVIIEAVDQGSGHLYVDTDDCRVAVTGTVFAVNHGMKGSRVSVIEGAVEVDHGGRHDVLLPGDQTTTHPSLSKIPVEDEIAWSRNVARYRDLLGEMRALGREMDAAIAPDVRYASDLLDLVPADTVVYAALPNLSGDLGHAYDIFQQRLATSDLLREWWDSTVVRQGANDEIDMLIDKIRAYGSQLGDEVVVALPWNDASLGEPVLLARIADPERFRSLLANELDEINRHEGGPFVELLDDGVVDSDDADTALYLSIRDNLLVAGPESAEVRAFTAGLDGADAGFRSTSFHARLRQRYDEGVEWLLGVDLERMLDARGDEQGLDTLDRLGLLDVQHLIVEQERRGENTQNQAVLTFDQDRRGVAAWLAQPAPMGSLEYVSPDAHFAAGFVMKDMGELVDEMFELIASADDDFEEHIARFEREQGIDVRRDFATPLGGEFAIAVDGPVLPKPSVLFIVQVYDAPRLQQTIEWTVRQLHQIIVDEGRRGLELRSETIGDRAYHRLESLDTGLGADYVFDEGYLIAAPSRVLLDRSMQNRRAGTTLSRSPRFQALLPEDGRVNFSAAVFQHLGPVLGRLGDFARTFTNPQQQQLAEALTEETGASLTLAYGDRDRIVLVGTSEGGLFGASLGSLLSLDGMMGIQQALTHTVETEVSAGEENGS